MAEYGLYFEMEIPEDVMNEFIKISGLIDCSIMD